MHQFRKVASKGMNRKGQRQQREHVDDPANEPVSFYLNVLFQLGTADGI